MDPVALAKFRDVGEAAPAAGVPLSLRMEAAAALRGPGPAVVPGRGFTAGAAGGPPPAPVSSFWIQGLRTASSAASMAALALPVPVCAFVIDAQ
jgi:hypothetical protein